LAPSSEAPAIQEFGRKTSFLARAPAVCQDEFTNV